MLQHPPLLRRAHARRAAVRAEFTQLLQLLHPPDKSAAGTLAQHPPLASGGGHASDAGGGAGRRTRRRGTARGQLAPAAACTAAGAGADERGLAVESLEHVLCWEAYRRAAATISTRSWHAF